MCDVLRSPTFELSGHPLQMVGYPKSPRLTSTKGRAVMGRPRAIPTTSSQPDFSLPPSPPASPSDGLKFSGRLVMEAPGVGTRLPVIVSVYSTPFDRYAVISQDRLVNKDFGYINLKNCSVQRVSSSAASGKKFQIRSVDGDRPPIVFHAVREEQVKEWMEVLEQMTSKAEASAAGPLSSSPRTREPLSKPHLSLSALDEEEEEEE